MINRSHRRLHLLRYAVVTCIGVFVTACAPRTANITETSKPAVVDPTVIQDRALEHFSQAIFYKPNEPKDFSFDIALAPLIVQEVKSPLDTVPRIAPYPIPDRERKTPPPPHSVTVQKRTARMSTKANPVERQYVYTDFFWRFPGHRKLGKETIPESRGVRVISTTENMPLVWQVLDNRDGPTVLYVSTELEKAAAEQFGPPLSGRKYSIERGLDEKPNVVVARVIESGPVPMGPYVYLSADDQSVTSIVCRCMSSQVNEFVETKYYDLDNLMRMESKRGTWFTKSTTKAELNSWDLVVVQSELRWPVLNGNDSEDAAADPKQP